MLVVLWLLPGDVSCMLFAVLCTCLPAVICLLFQCQRLRPCLLHPITLMHTTPAWNNTVINPPMLTDSCADLQRTLWPMTPNAQWPSWRRTRTTCRATGGAVRTRRRCRARLGRCLV